MNGRLVLCVFLSLLSYCDGQSKIDCSFQQRSFGPVNKVKPTKCGYQKGWHVMQRANWNIVNSTRDGKVTERAPEGVGGYFALFEAGKRPVGYVARFLSPEFTFFDDACISFYYVNKGTRRPYPSGRAKLLVFFHTNGKLPGKDDVPLWSGTERTSRNRWKKIQLKIAKKTNKNVDGQLVFVALRGKSKKSYIAIDDIKLHNCGNKEAPYVPTKKYYLKPAMRLVGGDTKPDPNRSPNDIMRILAAHRNVQTREFSIPPGSNVEPGSITLPQVRSDNRRRQRGRSRGNRRNRGNRRSQKKKEQYKIVYFTEDPIPSSENEEPFVPTLITTKAPILAQRPEILCDFMDYTQSVKRCMRTFFSMLQQHKSRRKCNSLFTTLETCLQESATSCVPTGEMSKSEVEQLVRDTLRTKFKTQQVYCEEEGAFVYPEFSVGSLPLKCKQEYFMKLTMCGGSFSGIFNIKHGDPKLCSEYYTANECQRRTTAQECNFDSRTMLIYGLNLQYQFAHNPFCIDLPFSAWWPHS